MTKRSLDVKIRKSQSFAKLNYRQRDLWQGIITMADDQGRMPGSVHFIKSEVWPYDDIPMAEVEEDINLLKKAEMILIYWKGEDCYLQIINWWKYQTMNWAGPSSFPAPDGWVDRMRYHGKENIIITINWDQSGGFVSTKPVEKQDSAPVEPLHSEQGSALHSELPTPLSSRDVKGEVNVESENIAEGEAKNRPDIFGVYEHEIGPLTPAIAEELQFIEQEHPPPWIIAAMKIAAINNKRSLAYTRAILKRWKAEGYGSEFKNQAKGNRSEPAGYAAIRAYLQEQGLVNVNI